MPLQRAVSDSHALVSFRANDDPSVHFRPRPKIKPFPTSPRTYHLSPSLQLRSPKQLLLDWSDDLSAINEFHIPIANMSSQPLEKAKVIFFSARCTFQQHRLILLLDQLPVPKNLLFIENDVPPSTTPSAATTPTDHELDPLAHAGDKAELLSQALHESQVPTKPKSPPNNVSRLGKLGQLETRLPDINAEPNEYYGGAQVTSRARTFSNVSLVSCSWTNKLIHNRSVSRVNSSVGLCKWAVRKSLEIADFRMVSTTLMAYADNEDESTPSAPRRYLIDVEETMRLVLEQEDTDNK